MTREEIKQNITMKDVLAKYGIKVNRNNMCCCPIHNEKHPSMQVFPDGFKCHACQAGGDIFAFVMKMENCDFKQAFISLGGTYEKNDNEKQRKMIKSKYARRKRQQESKTSFVKDFKLMFAQAITKCRNLIQTEEPMSDKWCDAQNAYTWLIYVWELYTNDEEINRADVIRMCKRVEGI